MALLASGCDYVLLTGGHEDGAQVVNTLYGNDGYRQCFEWPRLPFAYHGSGCTLAAAIAGRLAHGDTPLAAVQQAQQYTWQALEHAFRGGRGQLLPQRFWQHGRQR